MVAFFWLAVAVGSFLIRKSASNIVLSEEIKIRIEPKNEPPSATTTVSAHSPRILSSPSQLSVLVGDSVVLPCRVDLLGHSVVMWKRGRTATLFAGDMRVDQDQRFQLTERTFLQIERVTPEYAGEYICQVSTHPVTELVHTLHVLVAPSVRIHPADGHLIVKQGESAQAQCIAEGYPTPEVTWRALKGYLPGGVREKQGSALTLVSADARHSGTYECKADNGVGEAATALLRIKVFYPPELSVRPTWSHAGEGTSVEFECTATSEPPSSLYWTRISSNMILAENPHISLRHFSKPSEERLRLRIQRITPEHFGTYSCFANNTIGSSFRSVEVSGLAEPVRFRSNSSGDEDHSFMLTWTVKSYSPIIEYMLRVRPQKSKDSSSRAPAWTDVMIPVEMEQKVLYSHSYNITGLEPATSYEVVMQARNDFGWNHPSSTFAFYTHGDLQAENWEVTTAEEALSTPNFAADIPSLFSGEDANPETLTEMSSSSCSLYQNSVTLLLVIVIIS